MLKIINNIALLLTLILITMSCAKERDDVMFNANFKGARLDSVIPQGNNRYKLYIKPAFEPVNKSPYYAFSVQSKTKKSITVELDYGDYKHRYIPKLSYDRKIWQPINPKSISVDTLSGMARLALEVINEPLFVAAQEIETSQDTYNWLDDVISKHDYLKKVSAGKTVKQNDNYVVTSNPNVNNAIVLIARQHPPETPGGTIGFKAFYETLLNNSETAKMFRESFNIITFPLLNPDGADMGNWRHNANGSDLNRDWVDFSQPETRTVKNYVESKVKNGTKIKFAIDFHTSYSGPYLLILEAENEVKTKMIIPDWIKNIESNSDFKVEGRRRSQELPYCYNYFINTFNCEAVTYEDGDEIDRTIIKKRATIYAKTLMETLLKKHLNNAL